MIDLYTWTTPNGYKTSIMLEEIGADYTVHAINILENDQFEPSFLTISPNNKIPAIVDHDNGTTLMESGAILMYLAQKSGQLMPAYDSAAYWKMMQWLMWQMAGAGPMLGQAHHFLTFNPGKAPYAEERYGSEARRLYGVLDRTLAQTEFMAGEFSIADIATWPWVARFRWQGIDMNEFPNVVRWYLQIASRPAVQAGYRVPHDTGDIPIP